MPLLDHFRAPIWPNESWEPFHTTWAVLIAHALNRALPSRFKARPHVRIGSRIEADVAEFDTRPDAGDWNGANDGGGVSTLAVAAPALTLSAPYGLIDQFAVEVRDRDRDFRLAGVVELVSPGNKDRDDARQMFVGKAAGYLLTGVGLVVADVVTTRAANLHNEIVRLHGAEPGQLMAGPPATYAAAYAPTPAPDRIRLDVWAEPLAVGGPLPPLPLKVLGYGLVSVDLAATYREACEWSRLP